MTPSQRLAARWLFSDYRYARVGLAIDDPNVVADRIDAVLATDPGGAPR